MNPDHLFLGTQQENMEDMTSKGRHGNAKGEKNHKCVLSKNQVEAIRELISRHPSFRSGVVKFLGRWFGVGHPAISNIKHGRTWNHV